jgi:general secretion pathway protein G
LVIGESGNRVIDWAVGRVERNRARRGDPLIAPSINPSSNHPMTRMPDHSIREAGFTMIELLIVVSLIVILTTMGMTQYQHSVVYAREGVLKEDLFRIRDAIDQYYADKGQYPSTLDALVSDGYVRKLPDDPFTKNNTSWQTVPAEPDPNNPANQPGVYDVKSGAEGTTQDGKSLSAL